jgi:hypothetical protein
MIHNIRERCCHLCSCCSSAPDATLYNSTSLSWESVYRSLNGPTVSRPVRLGVRHPPGIRNQFFFLLEIFFPQLRVCYFVAPSLTKGKVWNLLLLLVLASAVRSGLSPEGLKAIFYCPNSWDSPNLKGQVPVFISPGNSVVQIYPRALGSLSVASYGSQGYGGSILSRLHTGSVQNFTQLGGSADFL